jgi:hypothetical protein
LVIQLCGRFITGMSSVKSACGDRAAERPGLAAKFTKVFENFYKSPYRSNGARAANLTRQTGPGPAGRRGFASGLRQPSSLAHDGQKFVALPSKAAHSGAAEGSSGIAPPARRFNVGLTVNRDDHVTRIPVVFVSGPPHSQEKKDADTGR